jgi:hypothetical protein
MAAARSGAQVDGSRYLTGILDRLEAPSMTQHW